MHLVAIGGSDAGISAALRARELDPDGEVTVVAADAYPNFSICGIPYYISGEVERWQNLAHRSREDLEAAGHDAADTPDPAGAGTTTVADRTSGAPRHPRPAAAPSTAGAPGGDSGRSRRNAAHAGEDVVPAHRPEWPGDLLHAPGGQCRRGDGPARPRL